jgi:hypothetical protein
MSKLFERVYQVAKMTGNPVMKRLAVKGYRLVVLGNDADKELPDVHGIPRGYDTYGRGGVDRDGSLFMEGGPQGSSSGHPSTLRFGFYWGTKTVTDNNRQEAGIVYVRGRAGVSEEEIRKVEVPILDWISKKVPRV